jgi:cytochrome P450
MANPNADILIPADEPPGLLPFPFPRPGLLQLAPELGELRESTPIVRVRTPAGNPAWLVTRHEDVKTLFADQRLGRSHHDPENAPRYSAAAILGGPMGEFETEIEDHALARKLLTPSFSARRMRMLRGRIQQIIDELLDRLAGLGQPADFHDAVSFRLPVLVICELLGVPYADRERFRQWARLAFDMTDVDASMQAVLELREYIQHLIDRKKAEPAADLISDLVLAQREDGVPDDRRIRQYVATLVIAGHETTVTFIDFGTLLLLEYPLERAKLDADLDLVPRAVEEILRFAPTTDACITRYARTDFSVLGVDIAKGEAVAFSPQAANRDPRVFPDPERFDVTRAENPHMTFTFGWHYCLGSPLVRVELDVLYRTLFRRLPGLRLAAGLDELLPRTDVLTGGITALPVRW